MTILGLILSLISGICWTIVYISMIRTGFKEKTYSMPLFALSLNISWELIYTIKGFSTCITNIQNYVNLTWCIFDFIIIYTYFKYGKNDFKETAFKKYFIPWSILIFAMSFIIEYGFLIEFGESTSKNLPLVSSFIETSLGAWYSAFLQNLIMSLLFISLLFKRNSLLGQNRTIAICKCIGTLTPTILFGIILENNLVLILGSFCFIFDLIYVFLVFKYISISKILN
ncbi:MAG: hypothetical protein E7G24_13000 [Clostridium celatum]|nr:hypothetical protein [Clostridium celatum]